MRRTVNSVPMKIVTNAFSVGILSFSIYHHIIGNFPYDHNSVSESLFKDFGIITFLIASIDTFVRYKTNHQQSLTKIIFSPEGEIVAVPLVGAAVVGVATFILTALMAHTPLIKDLDTISYLQRRAELGAGLLLFAVGLNEYFFVKKNPANAVTKIAATAIAAGAIIFPFIIILLVIFLMIPVLQVHLYIKILALLLC